MGMLDNLFKGLDGVLKDIEEGSLEKKLNNLAGMVDKSTKQVLDTTDRLAKAPGNVLKVAEQKQALVEQKVQVITKQATKAMDILPNHTDRSVRNTVLQARKDFTKPNKRKDFS